MNYIYDIFLNYNRNLYDIFEWNKDDKILHIRKIPVFLLSTNDLYNLINNRVVISKDLLTKLYKKTEVFVSRGIQYLDYAFIATDRNDVVAFKLNKNGFITGYSHLLLEGEVEVIDYSRTLSLQVIDYKILDKNSFERFKTRNEVYIKKFICEKLNKMLENKEFHKVKFLYLEFFNKEINDNTLIEEIYQELDNNWDNSYIKLYDFLKMMTIKR